MPEPPDLVIVGEDGSIRVAGRGAERRLRDRAGRYRLVVDGNGLLVLRADAAVDGKGTRLLMAGEIVSGTTMLEVINVIASSNWRGDLRVFGPGATRSLTIDRGTVKHAQSDSADDRLGEVLYRLGILTRPELEGLLRDVTPERRFGHLLVERGIVDREKLFAYLQKQVEAIFEAALLVREGSYAFTSLDDEGAPPPATVHIPVQSLLMEGVQRMDEMALFRERIPHGRVCPERKDGAPEVLLEEKLAAVLDLCDGRRTVLDIARETGFGEYATTKAVYHLLQQGQLLVHDGPKSAADPERVRKLVGAFNDVLRDVFLAVATYGGLDQTRDTLGAWLQGSGYAPFFGEGVNEDGTIDAERVAAAIDSTSAERPLEALHQALHELAAFALFAATTALPRDQEIVLSRDVNRRLKAIRLE